MTVRDVLFHVLMLPVYAIAASAVIGTPFLLYYFVMEEGWIGVLAIWTTASLIGVVVLGVANK